MCSSQPSGALARGKGGSTWVAGGSLGGFRGGLEARPKGFRRPKLPPSLSMTLGPLVDSMLARMPDWAAGTARAGQGSACLAFPWVSHRTLGEGWVELHEVQVHSCMTAWRCWCWRQESGLPGSVSRVGIGG